MNLGPRVKVTTVVAVFLLSTLIGQWMSRASFGVDGAPFEDMGMFIVANSFPANGTSAPNDLVAGHWGNMYNFTCALTVEFYFEENEIPRFNVTVTLPNPMVVYLDLGGSNLATPIYTNLRWSNCL